jgi:hypothetical protein
MGRSPFACGTLKIYYDPQHPGSFCGVDKLYKAVRQEGKYVLGRIKIRKWLETQETFNLRRQIMRKFHRRKVIAPFINYQWDETRKSGPLLYPKRGFVQCVHTTKRTRMLRVIIYLFQEVLISHRLIESSSFGSEMSRSSGISSEVPSSICLFGILSLFRD